MAQQVGEHHDWHSAEYVEKWINGDASRDASRRPRLASTTALLPFSEVDQVRILDVGGGYGEFTNQLLAKFAKARVCLQDFSAPMLSHARRRLAAADGRVDYVECDLRDEQWAEKVGGPFDAVVSSLVIHNVDSDTIRRVYRQIHDLLRPRGWFFNIDLIFDVELFQSSGALASLYARAMGEDGAEWYERHDYDETAGREVPGVSQHLTWLREAGFAAVDIPWKDFSEVFFAAHRAQ